jgi:signal transduction histidine kinase
MAKPKAGAGSRAAARRSTSLNTVRVPEAIKPLFLKAQDYVARYFSDRVENPEEGTISISGERYILLRAASMSVEFFDLVTSLYQHKEPDEARGVASNLLFDVAHAIGKADARTFHQRMRVSDPIEKLSAGPIHFSYSGWAFVDILPESRPAPDESFFLIYDHPFSFESDAWVRRKRTSEYPVCVMNAGYSSGWCEESFGLPLVAAEIECLAVGGKRCRFIMAPPPRIEEHLTHYSRRTSDQRRPSRTGLRGHATPVSIPEFFQRKRMEDELRQSHEGLEQRVKERTTELLEANDLLRREISERKRAEEVRDEFLSVAAHELKTPMTSLRGFAQVLMRQMDRDETPDLPRLRQAMRAIDQQSEKLSRLVVQLLDISRLEAGRLVLERKVTDVVGIVEGVLAGARTGAARHLLDLQAPSALLAFVDPLRLEQVITNLVDNAVKYSPSGGPVELDVSKRGALLRIAVTDHGIGVPKDRREQIFDRFYQAHTEHRLGGMGLGLYISRQIVELHAGKIEAEFPAAGGTRIVVTLPLGRREASAARLKVGS